jgi:hypothetical protein
MDVIVLTKLRSIRRTINSLSDDHLIEPIVTDKPNKKNESKDEHIDALVDRWHEEEKHYNIIQSCKNNTFKNLDDFLQYIKDNLKVIDITHEKIRIVSNVEKRIYNGVNTVLVIFEDSSRAFFIPELFAKCVISKEPIIHTLKEE